MSGLRINPTDDKPTRRYPGLSKRLFMILLRCGQPAAESDLLFEMAFDRYAVPGIDNREP